jgi:Zn-dependent oligopeptidase
VPDRAGNRRHDVSHARHGANAEPNLGRHLQPRRADRVPTGHPLRGVNHIVGSAGYYSYLWSKVYVQDLFARFSRDELLNPKTDAAYRVILANAGLDDADI